MSFLKEIPGITGQKELMDDLTTKYSKKGGFKTPEEAEKSYWNTRSVTGKNRENFKLPF